MVPGLAQGGQRVRGLARLGDRDGEHTTVEDRVAIAELRGDIHLDRQPGKRFDEVFPDESGVP